jgi:putative FmdB family regulatory protein
MPIYEYQCVDCGELDGRVGGIDDHASICAQCGGLMLRLDEDVFKPYFDNKEILQDAIGNDHKETLPAIRTVTRN